MSEIHLCMETWIPEDKQEEADLHAIEMNPENAGVPDPTSPLEGVMSVWYKWRNGSTITVCFLEGDPRVHKRIEPIAHEWSQYANIKFQFVDNPRADIRISFDPNGGSWSYLGVQSTLPWLRGKPSMNYAWLKPHTSEKKYRRFVLHEFGHALGLVHEHKSPSATIPWNEEAVIEHFKEKDGWPEKKTREQVLKRIRPGFFTRHTRFDKDSIMLYAFPKELTMDGKSTNWNTELSALDKEFIAQMYPRR